MVIKVIVTSWNCFFDVALSLMDVHCPTESDRN